MHSARATTSPLRSLRCCLRLLQRCWSALGRCLYRSCLLALVLLHQVSCLLRNNFPIAKHRLQLAIRCHYHRLNHLLHQAGTFRCAPIPPRPHVEAPRSTGLDRHVPLRWPRHLFAPPAPVGWCHQAMERQVRHRLLHRVRCPSADLRRFTMVEGRQSYDAPEDVQEPHSDWMLPRSRTFCLHRTLGQKLT